MQQQAKSEQGGGPPPPPPPPPVSRAHNDVAIRKYLSQNDWPIGLQNALIAGLENTPARFFICDDSGSMVLNDGKKLMGNATNRKLVKCSRWAELTETLKFHVNTAHIAGGPTEFRMLNGVSPISIGSSAQGDESGLPILNAILDGAPSGGTPLCQHVRDVTQKISAISSQLRAAGKKAALIICTDGEASDGDITAALKPLHDLPVWVVIRLCTDQDDIVGYWNNVDNMIELNMDVIDDPMGESTEIQALNTWMTYGMPLHRLREFGVTAKEIDMLDEVKLSPEQMHKFCAYLFGIPAKDLPHPDVDWKEFYDQIYALNEKEPMVWSSTTKGPARWINMKNLIACYGPAGFKDSRNISDPSGAQKGACCTIA